MKEEVILVNENDEVIGTMEKLEAHKKGVLHRAFSVFVFNEQGDLLLQKRAYNKYHSAGLWTNTCCSHPRPNEININAASRRLQEEMGLETPLKEQFFFIYKTEFENGLTEHELDYVFFGYTDQNPVPNPMEVAEYKWISIEDLKREIKENAEQYTSWFKIVAERVF